MRKNKETYDLFNDFERIVKEKNSSLVFVPNDFKKEKGTNDRFLHNRYYTNGIVNQAFLAFVMGVSLGRCLERQDNS